MEKVLVERIVSPKKNESVLAIYEFKSKRIWLLKTRFWLWFYKFQHTEAMAQSFLEYNAVEGYLETPRQTVLTDLSYGDM